MFIISISGFIDNGLRNYATTHRVYCIQRKTELNIDAFSLYSGHSKGQDFMSVTSRFTLYKQNELSSKFSSE